MTGFNNGNNNISVQIATIFYATYVQTLVDASFIVTLYNLVQNLARFVVAGETTPVTKPAYGYYLSFLHHNTSHTDLNFPPEINKHSIIIYKTCWQFFDIEDIYMNQRQSHNIDY